MKKLYLAGPMTGLPNNNREAFHKAAKELREAGYEVVNPAELDEALGDLKTPQEYYLRDIPYLLQCDEVVCLPGWRESRGAVLEVFIMLNLGRLVWQAASPRFLGEDFYRWRIPDNELPKVA